MDRSVSISNRGRIISEIGNHATRVLCVLAAHHVQKAQKGLEATGNVGLPPGGQYLAEARWVRCSLIPTPQRFRALLAPATELALALALAKAAVAAALAVARKNRQPLSPQVTRDPAGIPGMRMCIVGGRFGVYWRTCKIESKWWRGRKRAADVQFTSASTLCALHKHSSLVLNEFAVPSIRAPSLPELSISFEFVDMRAVLSAFAKSASANAAAVDWHGGIMSNYHCKISEASTKPDHPRQRSLLGEPSPERRPLGPSSRPQEDQGLSY